MIVKKLIEELSKLPPDAEVIISDGYRLIFYKGNWIIKEFEGEVDIGIGGTEINE